MKNTEYQVQQITPASCCAVALSPSILKDFLDGQADKYVAEVKEDGHRYLLHVCPDKSDMVFLTSRRISKKTGRFCEKQNKMVTIRDWDYPAAMLGCVFDGEIRSGKMSSDTAHGIAHGEGTYHVWDLLFYQGFDYRAKSQTFRFGLLKAMSEKGCFPPWMKLIRSSDAPTALLTAVLKEGGEGIILKQGKSKYGEGWIKVKPSVTHDCIVIGHTMSTEGKYLAKGWIKSLKIGQWLSNKDYDKLDQKVRARLKTVYESVSGKRLVDVGSISGFDEILRAKISKNPKAFFEKLVEVESQQRLDSGKFRHPRFLRWRNDKNESECRWVVEKA